MGFTGMVMVSLSSFGVTLRLCMSWWSVSVCPLVAIELSWCCSFGIADALMVMASSSLWLSSANVAGLVVVFQLCVLSASS